MSATSLQKIDAIDGNLASLMSSSSTLVDGVAKVQLSQAGKVSSLYLSRLTNLQEYLKNMASE